MKYLVLTFPFFLVFFSCQTQMYVSNAVNAPLLKERGEVQVAVTRNDIQGAAAVGEHVAVMANGYFRQEGSGTDRHGGMFGEFGLGAFKSLSKNVVVEGFTGAGYGRVYKEMEYVTNETTKSGKFNSNLFRYFIQPDIGYKSKIVDLVLSSRFSFVKYSHFNAEGYPEEELKNDYLDGDRLTAPLFVFAEPAFTVRFGFKFLKIQFQQGLTLNVTGQPIKHADSFSSVGLIIDIARWYRE